MVKTQIQLPDDLYQRVNQLAKQKEWSLARNASAGERNCFSSSIPRRSLFGSRGLRQNLAAWVGKD
jgi:hypothetical protein